MRQYLLAAYAAVASLRLPLSSQVSPHTLAVHDYILTCYAIERAVSPLSAVFYPGTCLISVRLCNLY